MKDKIAPQMSVLTRRQRQILALKAVGYTCKEIARELGISPSTVIDHQKRAQIKLGLSTRRANILISAAQLA